eukprot:TRINITY_DN8937_c0_g1_i1.p1 TRINITY_DN8937_c0_g1~~TRINITY_DN8937_c0_g1_i1.p1  ORF type:complete len:381 (+),score=59.34 TRINITY_DN8937_c0_g1_i1:570-1712(+)
MQVAEAPPSLPSPPSPLACKMAESAIICYSPVQPMAVEENSRIRVRQFPSRLLMHIFSYLRPKQLAIVIQTCRAWRSAGAKLLWKHINLSGKINFENQFFVTEFLVRYADVVEVLNVSNNSSVDDKMIRLILQNCKRLKDLNISNTSVTSWGLIPIYQQTFCSVNTLEKLDISNTAKLKSVLSYPKNLKELNMAEACEGSGYLQCYKLVTLNILGPVRPFIRYITKLSNLQNLCISAAVLKQLPKESWDVLKGRLRRLEIWNVRKTPWKYGENPKDRILPHLTELKLVNVYFYSAFPRNIETIMPCCPKLKKLVFHQQSGMCDDGAKLDAPIFDMIARCCPLLEELHVPRSALASNQANQTHQIEDKLRAIFSKGVVVIT